MLSGLEFRKTILSISEGKHASLDKDVSKTLHALLLRLNTR